MSTTTSTTMCKRGHGRRISYYHTHTAEPHGGSARDLRRKICAPTKRLIVKAKTLSLHRSRAIHSISVIMMLVVDREFSGIQLPYRTYGTTMWGVAVEGCSTPNTYLQYVSRYYYCSLFQILQLQDDYDADAWSVTVGKVFRAMHWRSPGGLLVWWGRGNVMWLDDASRGIP